jgi:glycosyltransferase involved in cell wall biosynthesis
MRVVIASRIFSPEPSAASFMLDAIARGFRDAGHDVTVLTTRPPRGVSVVEIPGLRVTRARVLRDATGYVRGYLPYLSFDVPLFFRLVFGRRADLYLVEPPPTTGAVVRVATALLRRPYIYDAADVWSDAAAMATSSPLVLAVLRRIEVFAWRGAAHTITISAGVAERMRELGAATPTTVTGFGVDVSAFRYEGADEDAQPYFVYAGTYSEWHGADIFVDAFARFSRDHPGYRLVFVGNGSERQLLERRCAELGLDSVEFIDPIDGPSLSRIFASATGSLASLKPGQGYDYAFTTKLYGSIAAGCPVVFTGVGPTAEFIERHSQEQPLGEAVAYDPDAVSGALARLASAPPGPDRRKSLSEWARSRFSLDAIADAVVRIGTAIGTGTIGTGTIDPRATEPRR